MKKLFGSQSTFCFLKIQGQDLIPPFLFFFKKIWSRQSPPTESPQSYGVICLSFCAHLTLFLVELKHHCQTPGLTQGLIFLLKRQMMLLPYVSTSFLWGPVWKNAPQSGTPKNLRKQGCNRTVVWGKTSISLERHGEDSKHRAEIQGPEHNLTLPEVKWIISINPGQTMDWLCWYFPEEKWLFCTYSKSKGHTLFIFATL